MLLYGHGRDWPGRKDLRPIANDTSSPHDPASDAVEMAILPTAALDDAGWTNRLADLVPDLQARNIDRSRWRIAQEFEAREWQLSEIVRAERHEFIERYAPVIDRLRVKGLLDGRESLLEVGSGPTCPSTALEIPRTYVLDPLMDRFFGVRDKAVTASITAIGEDLPFDDGTFSIVFSRNSIDHGLSPRRAIHECVRVLDNRGLLILGQWIYAPAVAVAKQLAERSGVWRNAGHPHAFSVRHFEALVEDHATVVDSGVLHVASGSSDFGKLDSSHDSPPPFSHRLLSTMNRALLRSKWFAAEAFWFAVKD